MKTPIYLDYQATTPVDPRVLERMLPYFSEIFGNPHSSAHAFGWAADEAVEQARREVAALLDGRRKRCRVRPGGALEIDVALRLGGGACGLSPSLASSRCGAAGVGASPATLRALPKEGLSDNEDESAQLVADAQAAADADDADGHARRDAPRGGPVAVEMTTWKQAEQ